MSTASSGCIASASMLGMFINITITTVIAVVQYDEKISEKVRKKPPFFFKEVRLGQLIVAGLYNLARFIYEGTKLDSSQTLISSTMVVIAIRICVTIIIIIEHRWLCNHWEEFYVERKKKTYLWFRFFWITCFIHCATGLRQLSLTHDGVELMFSIVGGMNMIYWYYWGRKFQWKWGEDMTDSRRLVALRNAMSLVTIIYLIYSVYDVLMYNVISALTPLVVMCGHFTLSLVLFYVVNLEQTNRHGFWHTYKTASQVLVSELPPPEIEQNEIQRQLEVDEEMNTIGGEEKKNDGIHPETNPTDDGKNFSDKQSISNTLSDRSLYPQLRTTRDDNAVVPYDYKEDDDANSEFSPTSKFTTTTHPNNIEITENMSPTWRAARMTTTIPPTIIPPPPRPSENTTENVSSTWLGTRRVSVPKKTPQGSIRTMRVTWSIMRRQSVNVLSRDQRELLEKRLRKQDVGYLIGDKLATVIPQVEIYTSPLASLENKEKIYPLLLPSSPLLLHPPLRYQRCYLCFLLLLHSAGYHHHDRQILSAYHYLHPHSHHCYYHYYHHDLADSVNVSSLLPSPLSSLFPLFSPPLHDTKMT